MRPARWGVAAVVACGVCCSLPLIAVLTGIGVLSGMAAVFELISLVIAVLALGAAAVLWVRRRRRRKRGCRVTGPVDLELTSRRR